MRWRGLVQKMLPWPSRAERLAAIEQARQQKERSLADLAHAQGVKRDIEHEAHRNHWASWIEQQIIEGHGGHGR